MGAFLSVAECLVRLGHFFEAGLGFGVARIAIRMQLACEFAERTLDLVGRSGLAHAKQVVVVGHVVSPE